MCPRYRSLVVTGRNVSDENESRVKTDPLHQQSGDSEKCLGLGDCDSCHVTRCTEVEA